MQTNVGHIMCSCHTRCAIGSHDKRVRVVFFACPICIIDSAIIILDGCPSHVTAIRLIAIKQVVPYMTRKDMLFDDYLFFNDGRLDGLLEFIKVNCSL